MLRNKKIFFVFGLFFVSLILSLSLVSAQFEGGNKVGQPFTTGQGGDSFSSSSVQYNQPGFHGGGGVYGFYDITPGEYQEVCNARQDFVVQVAPGGCTPAVVRSDLLEERDVRVFCKLQAYQANPMIDPSYIKTISLLGRERLPNGISNVYYYRPKAALSTRPGVEGLASIDNIGYLVIVLKRQANESSMPEFLSGNLTLRMTYDVPLGFGMGTNEMRTPILSDEEWKNEYLKYGFLDGKAYLRLRSLDGNGAVVDVYSDAEHRIDSFSVAKGQSSGNHYLPGLYCNAGCSLSYTDSDKPQPKAVIVLDNNRYDVYQGEDFADKLCKLNKVDSDGYGGGRAEVYCHGKRFDLVLSQKNVLLKVGEENEEVKVGDLVHTTSGENANKIYLGYKGKLVSGEDFIIVVSTSDDNGFDASRKADVSDYGKKISSGEQVSNPPVGTKVLKIGENTDNTFVSDVIITFSGVAGGSGDGRVDTSGNNFENYFKDSVDGYKDVAESYDGEAYLDRKGEKPSIGQKSLDEAIKLASGKNKDKTKFELEELLKEKYDVESLSNELTFDTSLASYVLDLGNEIHVLTLQEIETPGFDEVGLEISLNGETQKYSGVGNYILSKGSSDTSIKISDFDKEKVVFEVNCKEGDKLNKNSESIDLGQTKTLCNNEIGVRTINYESVARVRLNPINRNVGSEVNVSYAIGIEKRAIKLNPAQTQERIKKLNETIARWQNISDSLSSVVTGMKAACFATSATLQVKNLFGNLGGKAIARQEVMRGSGGWYELCTEALSNGGVPVEGKGMASGPYASLDDCYRKNNDLIEQDVNLFSSSLTNVNNEIKRLEESSGAVSSSEGLFGGKSVDYSKARNAYCEELKRKMSGKNIIFTKKVGNEDRKIEVDEVLKDLKCDSVGYDQLRDIATSYEVYENTKSVDRLREGREKELYDSFDNLKQIKGYDKTASLVENVEKNLKVSGNLAYTAPNVPEGATAGIYNGAQAKINGNDEFVHMLPYRGNSYLVTLNKDNENYYRIKSVYDVNDDGNIGSEITNNKINPEDDKSITIQQALIDQYPSLIFKDAGSYQNVYKNPEVRYYETDPYKGMPAVVPINTNEGWYAATKPTLGILGQVGSFKESGEVSSFWLCNVGENGREEFSSGLGDDTCQQFNVYTGQEQDVFPGLGADKTLSLVNLAKSSLRSAANQYKAGADYVTINGKKLPVGSSAPNVLGTQCQDFMSPADCHIMFNVCDPVICPSSRCNLGGKYQVSDVVQTGVVGSALLCLPNAKEGIAIPVCLTGIQAGLDNYVSILKASRDCLQENVNSGRYVGICDEITAIYTCEFFWKQISPAVNVLLPKLLESATGRGTRGGGEYLTVQNAWSNMQNSIDYFKNYYAENSLRAFRVRSTEEVGTPICKSFTSLRFPNKFKTLIEPDSPYQFSAWFTEIKQSDAVSGNAISHYKVYYHIFAGNDQGVYYSVYLKDSPGFAGVQGTGSVFVDTGFIGRGEYVDLAKDFTAPSNYQQLCVRINAKEECGFKQVSTSFALDYLRDKYVQGQINNNQITSEKSCVSGDPNALALINPNIQAGVEEASTPRDYSRGIIRICGTANPGEGTQPDRWQRVGYCGDSKIGCWLDRESVDRAISSENIGVKNQTISELDALKEELEDAEKTGGDMTEEEFNAKISQTVKDLIKVEGEIKLNQYSFENAEDIYNRLNVIENSFNDLRLSPLSPRQEGVVIYYKAKINAARAEIAWLEHQSTIVKTKTETPDRLEDIKPGEEGNILVTLAIEEYERWEKGKLDECSGKGKVILKEYYDSVNFGSGWDCKSTPWSGVFISYIVKRAALNFPFSASHSQYFTQIRDNPGKYSCNAYDIQSINNIKVGDILCNCRDSGCPATFNNLQAGSPGHCDIVTSRSGDNL